jgi:hemerythrin-like domain-containing protein
MKTATKNLEDDHVHILKLIDVMEHITQIENPDVHHLEQIVEIIRNFADGLHHAKEENLFFPLLAERGFSPTQGPVAVMLHEHVLGRNFVKGMADSITQYKSGNKAASGEIFRNMKGYSELLRNHISKENNILFRMADNALSESDNINLLSKFTEAEKNHIQPADSKAYSEQIKDLAYFYNIGNKE